MLLLTTHIFILHNLKLTHECLNVAGFFNLMFCSFCCYKCHWALVYNPRLRSCEILPYLSTDFINNNIPGVLRSSCTHQGCQDSISYKHIRLKRCISINLNNSMVVYFWLFICLVKFLQLFLKDFPRLVFIQMIFFFLNYFATFWD